MARTSATPAVAAPVAAAAPAAKPAVKPVPAAKAPTPTPPVETPKAPAAKKVAAVPTPATAAPVTSAAPVDAAAAAATVEASPFEEIGVLIAGFLTGLKETQAKLKTLSKEFEKMKKAVEKTERKRANARTNPNGFAKPTKIVDELCVFCGVAPGSMMSRTDVTRFINSYIKSKDLNKPENKRIIVPDEKLRTLLKLKAGDEVNYFKMQTYISPLFIKETPAATA